MDAAMTEAGYQEVRQTEDQGRREANMDLEADALKVICTPYTAHCNFKLKYYSVK